jgi:hypothetical protein
MPALSNPRHERFAQERFKGLTCFAAYKAAGYGGGPNQASKISRRPEVRARITELSQTSADSLMYDRQYVVRKLVAIIEAPPSDAKAEHPLCEKRMVGGEPHYLFPSKLEAIEALNKMMGWNQSAKAEPPPAPPPDKFVQLLECIRKRK